MSFSILFKLKKQRVSTANYMFFLASYQKSTTIYRHILTINDDTLVLMWKPKLQLWQLNIIFYDMTINFSPSRNRI